MYELKIEDAFAAAHNLREYQGQCEELHGHNWKVEVTVRATELDQFGMGIDVKDLKNLVKAAIDKLDHKDLNTLPYFTEQNPSSEHIARFIYDETGSVLPGDNYRIFSVKVMETDNQGVIYYGAG